MRSKITSLLISSILIVCLVVGCTTNKKPSSSQGGKDIYYTPTTTVQQTTEKVRYNKSDTAILMAINEEAKTLTVKSAIGDEAYILNYSGATEVLGKKGTVLTMTQLEIGQIVDVYYVDGSQKLIKIQVSSKAWENTLATGLTIIEDGILSIANTTYRYDDRLVVLEGKLPVSLERIDSLDDVTIRGIDNNIFVISVNKGHGYIKVTDVDKFDGGVLEIGSRITKIVNGEMMFAVPEGEYKISISNNGVGGTDTIEVVANEVYTLSLMKYRGEVDKTGLLKLNVTPTNAQVYIDGVKTDYTSAVQLDYGTHKLSIKAEGYEEYVAEVTMDSIYKTLNINLEKEEFVEENATTEASSEATDLKIYITGPAGATVFFDGLYKGSAPVSFEKVTGNHVVIITGIGMETKTYTIYIPDDGKDYIKNFAE